ncbi:ribonuclease E inhibitor RraA/Dimethylmenaquinone methyltransferase [Exophiala viscosa]|uniref:ribonuclease E inhibitor RraA/Dimethylmenaquinone methyltransferase n=1 Tax=Exophiala viscosa TaxID=2486360 RepID=UPI00218E1098|nr:ribonuclease E inhibitor RraA/Dimethylmenaquinone methyltransferase [Exophiala viscosa]
MSTGAGSLQAKLRSLHEYSACDVSDGLLKLQKPKPGEIARGGFLVDIEPFALPQSSAANQNTTNKIIAPACTVKLVPKQSPPDSTPPAENTIPKGSHWVDLTESGSVVVIDQPEGQKCAAVGGMMAARMKIRGVAGCIVGGRVRDITELKSSELPIFALGRSTVGTSAEATPYARNVPVSITGVNVSPGDIIFCDPTEGVVVIPQELLDETLSLIPKLVAADDKVKEAVEGGMTVAEAFKKFRE